MLEFTRDGASGGPKAIVLTENEKQLRTQFSMLTKIGGFSVWCFKHCHKLDQALHISVESSDGE